MLSNFEITVDGDKAQSYSHVYASHIADSIDYWDAYGRYYHELEKLDAKWQITNMTLLMHGQKGNQQFLQEAIAMNEQQAKLDNQSPNVRKVSFQSEGQNVVGDLYLPADFDANKQYPAIVVSGSWTTVKEQMAGLYASKLAKQGFIALAFEIQCLPLRL